MLDIHSYAQDFNVRYKNTLCYLGPPHSTLAILGHMYVDEFGGADELRLYIQATTIDEGKVHIVYVDEVGVEVGLRGLGYVNVARHGTNVAVAVTRRPARQWRRGYSDSSVDIQCTDAARERHLWPPKLAVYEACWSPQYYAAHHAYRMIMRGAAVDVAITPDLMATITRNHNKPVVYYRGSAVGELHGGGIVVHALAAEYNEAIKQSLELAQIEVTYGNKIA